MPVIVTEHGISTPDDSIRGRVHRAVAGRPARRDATTAFQCSATATGPCSTTSNGCSGTTCSSVCSRSTGRRSNAHRNRAPTRTAASSAPTPSDDVWPSDAAAERGGSARSNRVIALEPGCTTGRRIWLRREFELGASAARALLRLSARGLVELYVNGVRVGDELLPGYVQYDRRLPLRTIEVSEQLRQGDNAVTIVLADGWFRGQTGALRAADQLGTSTSVWVEIDVDGDLVVTTDGSWRSRPSHITEADLIAGQTEDRRRFDPAMLLPGFDDSGWNAVTVRRTARRPARGLRRTSGTACRGDRGEVGHRAATTCAHRRPRPEHQRVDTTSRPRPGGHGTHAHPRRVVGARRRRHHRSPDRRLPLPAERRCPPARSTVSSPQGTPATCSSHA